MASLPAKLPPAHAPCSAGATWLQCWVPPAGPRDGCGPRQGRGRSPPLPLCRNRLAPLPCRPNRCARCSTSSPPLALAAAPWRDWRDECLPSERGGGRGSRPCTRHGQPAPTNNLCRRLCRMIKDAVLFGKGFNATGAGGISEAGRAGAGTALGQLSPKHSCLFTASPPPALCSFPQTPTSSSLPPSPRAPSASASRPSRRRWRRCGGWVRGGGLGAGRRMLRRGAGMQRPRACCTPRPLPHPHPLSPRPSPHPSTTCAGGGQEEGERG